MELISIIVPVYKVEPYLDKCVSSIVNQTYKNLEIILVDDGSPDNCPAMCDTWAEKDDRIRVIHKLNGGLSDARNAGVAAATGEFVAFVDSDDWIDIRYVEYLHQAILQTGADISACDLREVYDESAVDDDPVTMPQVEVAAPEDAIEDILHNRRFRAVACNKLYANRLLTDKHFEINRLHEDEFLSYQLYDKSERLAYIEVPLYNYRQRAGSIMTTFSVRHIDALDAYLERIALIEQRYPRLLSLDKLNFCMTCLNMYGEAATADAAHRADAKRRIKGCRRQVHFSYKELRKYSLKEKLYVCMSDERIIGITCWLRNRRRNRQNG